MMLTFRLLVSRGITVLRLNHVWNWLFDTFFVSVIVNLIFLINSLTVKVDCLGVLELNPPQGISCKFSRDLFNTINRFPLISEQYNTLSALPHTYSLRPFSLNHVCNFADLTSMCLLAVRTLKLYTLSVLSFIEYKIWKK